MLTGIQRVYEYQEYEDVCTYMRPYGMCLHVKPGPRLSGLQRLCAHAPSSTIMVDVFACLIKHRTAGMSRNTACYTHDTVDRCADAPRLRDTVVQPANRGKVAAVAGARGLRSPLVM